MDIQRSKMELVEVITPEYLSSDIFEENFLKTFLVLHRLQFMMGSCRIDVKNRFATPPTTVQKYYTILCILVTIAANFAMANFCNSVMNNHAILFLGLSNILILSIVFLFNLAHVRFFNGTKNVEFFVKMQKFDRFLKIHQWNELDNALKLVTNVSVTLILTAFVFLMILACVEQGIVCVYFFGPAYCLLTILFELTACSTIIAYFVFRMRFINGMMKNYLAKEKIPKPKESSFLWMATIRYYAQETQRDFNTSDINIYLRELLKCFTVYQELYRFQLFMFCIQSVVSCVVSFEMVLYSMKESGSSLLELSLFTLITVVYLTMAIFLSLRYELFFNEVRETKRLCINIMAKHYEGPLRKKARKMLKMIDETPPRFSVYEMWDMNAGTIVTMFSLITSLIVTLLQLAFL